MAGASTVDSAGVRIVHLPALATIDFPVWTSTILFSTAGNDSLEPYKQPVVSATFAPDTSLWVANGSDIVVLAPDGSFARRVGRQGDGPGEFRQVFTLGPAANGAFLASELAGRVTELDRRGVADLTVSRLEDFAGREIEPLTVLADRRILAVPWQWRPNRGRLPMLPGTPFQRDPVPLLVYDSTGQAIDTVGIWRGLERSNGFPVPFGRSAVLDSRANTTVIGVSDSLDLSLFDGTALKLRLIAPAERRHATPEDRAAWNAAVRREMGDVITELLKIDAGLPDVPQLPNIGGIVVDEHQNIWVGAYVTPNQGVRTWRVFSSSGQPLGRLDLPALHAAFVPSRAELLDVFGGRIALLRENADGEAFIEVRSVR